MSKTKDIWELRYKTGGNSGTGSYGKLCQFKADIINNFIHDNNCKNVIEFGSGDGNQMLYFDILHYTGIDISEFVVAKCKEKYRDLTNRRFMTYYEYYDLKSKEDIKYDIALSLDVIYHLVEDTIFEKYMDDLFNSTNKYIIIYSTDFDEQYNGSHVRHRKFTDYIRTKYTVAKLLQYIPQKFPNDSTANFYIYSIN